MEFSLLTAHQNTLMAQSSMLTALEIWLSHGIMPHETIHGGAVEISREKV